MTADSGHSPMLLPALRRIAADDSMRPVLHELLGLCRVEEASRDEFREGERGVGIRIMAWLDDADPGIRVKLAAERAVVTVRRQQAEAAEAVQ